MISSFECVFKIGGFEISEKRYPNFDSLMMIHANFFCMYSTITPKDLNIFSEQQKGKKSRTNLEQTMMSTGRRDLNRSQEVNFESKRSTKWKKLRANLETFFSL